MIRPMMGSDLEAVVRIHLNSFPGFFLSFLGYEFLALMYQGIQRDPEGIVLVFTSREQVDGFVAGVIHQKDFYRRLIKEQKWEFMLAALGAALRRPKIVPRLLRALRRPAEAKQSAAQALLMSIAVRPLVEGKGIGRQLVLAFCQVLMERGVESVCLTTDRDHNDRVNRFYEQLGFRVSRSYITPEGRAINEYVRTLA